MMRAVQDLSLGYYGWRDGSLTELTFPDGSTKRIAPDLNAGSVAIQYYFAQKLDPERWAQAIDPRVGFPAQYADMFGDPWAHAHLVEPLIPAGLTQPHLNLPFEAGTQWAYTGGPHSAWEHEGALAALDFAPNETSGCSETDRWVVASAPGLVVRSDHGVVVLDLDGDGSEETGWSLLYLHIATKGRVPLNTWVEADERIGKPSCEGGVATGTHLHFARKYNGEWILADSPLPFEMEGWLPKNGQTAYEGTLVKNGYTVIASSVSDASSQVTSGN
jgi:murein DD-endopeptidase MepM/ murein hydrolase activator NlpD